MKCFVCGSEMRRDQMAGEESVSVSGFEHRTFRCSSCGDVERRLVLSTARDAEPAEPEPAIQSPAIQSSTIQSCSTDEQSAAPAAVRQPAKKLSGIYTRLRRLLPFRRESVAPLRAPAAAPSAAPPANVETVEPAPRTTPTLRHALELGHDSTRAGDNLAECEALLKHAIEMVHGPARSAQAVVATNLEYEAPLPSPEALVTPDLRAADSLQSARESDDPKKPRVVEIDYDPVKFRYAARDAATGFLVMRHEDRSRLKGMCERMGWQVVEDASVAVHKSASFFPGVRDADF